ncbi:MAG: DNA primase [Candidatus Paracaedibacteraceae bacterium]|nr:DNA primase [Candidatus Paracaedibacteraceae bacterium]
MSELSNVTEQIKNRILITDVLSPFVQFQRRNNRIVGLCPFHKEKSPSFNIDNVKGSYHCFGCGKHGDHFTFLTEHQGMTFGEALQHLADKAGVEVPKRTHSLNNSNASASFFDPAIEKSDKSYKEKLQSYMEMACAWYQAKLEIPQAQHVRDYLIERSVSEEMINRFRVGFAPTHESLGEYLRKQGIAQKDLVAVGLVTENGADRFKGRLMFPICDQKGLVIAFGGRALQKDQMPKYLNSAETPLFHKSSVLYAQHQAFSAVTREKAPLVVEGYMDVIALHQYGFETAVAPLGTAFSDDHMKRLWQRHPSPIFCFDGDEAGQKAAFRVAQKVFPLLKPHFQIQFCFLPNGEDPDTFLKTYGKNDFNKIIQTPTSLTNTLWNGYLKSLNINSNASPEEKTILKKSITEHVNEIQDGDLKQFFQRDFNDKFYYFFATFSKFTKKNQLKSAKENNFPTVLSAEIVQTLKKVKKSHLPAKILLATLKNNPTLITMVDEALIDLDDLPHDLARLRDFLCERTFECPKSLHEEAVNHGLGDILTSLDNINLRTIAPFAMLGANTDIALQGWMDVWQQHYFRLRIQKETHMMKARLKNSMNEKSWEQWQQFKTELNHDTKN